MKMSVHKSAELAGILMNAFAERTGLTNPGEVEQDRYLWTDAFAVQNFLALSAHFGEDRYKALARELIEQVHYTLGRFAPEDTRSGWISQLSEEEGRRHPTVHGLRIGKKQLERKESEPRDANKEWERDGQYYHYHTRWINALLKAAEYLDSETLTAQAAELSLAGRYFLDKTVGRPHLYWKMSVDLSYPQVVSMGAHDPLDGYLAALACKMSTSDNYDFTDYLKHLETLCRGRNWQTADPLGLGGLLLNIIRAAELDRHTTLPPAVRPQKLLSEAGSGLEHVTGQANLIAAGRFRLAFRECGLSLGLRVIDHYENQLMENYPPIDRISQSLPLAERIEAFWSQSNNREQASYLEHRNINDVSLSSSLLANIEPAFFQ